MHCNINMPCNNRMNKLGMSCAKHRLSLDVATHLLGLFTHSSVAGAKGGGMVGYIGSSLLTSWGCLLSQLWLEQEGLPS